MSKQSSKVVFRTLIKVNTYGLVLGMGFVPKTNAKDIVMAPFQSQWMLSKSPFPTPLGVPV